MNENINCKESSEILYCYMLVFKHKYKSFTVNNIYILSVDRNRRRRNK